MCDLLRHALLRVRIAVAGAGAPVQQAQVVATPTAPIELSELSLSRHAVALALADEARATDDPRQRGAYAALAPRQRPVSMHVGEIARRARCKLSCVRAVLAELEALGLIHRVESGVGRGRRPSWALHPLLVAAAGEPKPGRSSAPPIVLPLAQGWWEDVLQEAGIEPSGAEKNLHAAEVSRAKTSTRWREERVVYDHPYTTIHYGARNAVTAARGASGAEQHVGSVPPARDFPAVDTAAPAAAARASGARVVDTGHGSVGHDSPRPAPSEPRSPSPPGADADGGQVGQQPAIVFAAAAPVPPAPGATPPAPRKGSPYAHLARGLISDPYARRTVGADEAAMQRGFDALLQAEAPASEAGLYAAFLARALGTPGAAVACRVVALRRLRKNKLDCAGKEIDGTAGKLEKEETLSVGRVGAATCAPILVDAARQARKKWEPQWAWRGVWEVYFRLDDGKPRRRGKEMADVSHPLLLLDDLTDETLAELTAALGGAGLAVVQTSRWIDAGGVERVKYQASILAPRALNGDERHRVQLALAHRFLGDTGAVARNQLRRLPGSVNAKPHLPHAFISRLVGEPAEGTMPAALLAELLAADVSGTGTAAAPVLAAPAAPARRFGIFRATPRPADGRATDKTESGKDWGMVMARLGQPGGTAEAAVAALTAELTASAAARGKSNAARYAASTVDKALARTLAARAISAAAAA